MRMEDREEFVDQVAQAVIDKIEERDRIESMVSLVTARVLALQQEQKDAAAVLAEASNTAEVPLTEGPLTTASGSTDRLQESTHVEH